MYAVENSPANNIERTISLWGPTSSGKTWLLNSFSRTLMKYNAHDPDFVYELTEIKVTKEVPDFGLKPIEKIRPTIEMKEIIWRFRSIVPPVMHEPLIAVCNNNDVTAPFMNKFPAFISNIDKLNTICLSKNISNIVNTFLVFHIDVCNLMVGNGEAFACARI